jgi:hypothetical protein
MVRERLQSGLTKTLRRGAVPSRGKIVLAMEHSFRLARRFGVWQHASMQSRDVRQGGCGRGKGIEAVLCGVLALFTPMLAHGKSNGDSKTVVDTDLTITAATNPYLLNGALVVSGGGRKTITLSPGVDIESGKIELGNRGTLLIQGTKTAPVILRNVSILQELGGSVKADFAVFDHCSFWKSGGWFASYSSKWEMTSCLLYQCFFPRLTAVDYGFKFNRCTFVSMKFPEIGSRRSKVHPFDHMKALRQEWRTATGWRRCGRTRR